MWCEIVKLERLAKVLPWTARVGLRRICLSRRIRYSPSWQCHRATRVSGTLPYHSLPHVNGSSSQFEACGVRAGKCKVYECGETIQVHKSPYARIAVSVRVAGSVALQLDVLQGIVLSNIRGSR